MSVLGICVCSVLLMCYSFASSSLERWLFVNSLMASFSHVSLLFCCSRHIFGRSLEQQQWWLTAAHECTLRFSMLVVLSAPLLIVSCSFSSWMYFLVLQILRIGFVRLLRAFAWIASWWNASFEKSPIFIRLNGTSIAHTLANRHGLFFMFL